MKLLWFLILLFLSNVSFGQKYLNDTTLFNARLCLFNSAFEADSGIYVAALGNFTGHGNMTHLLLGFYDSTGNSALKMNDFDTLNMQNLSSNMGDLIYNERGNFVFYYKNCDTVKCYTRIKEITPNGFVVADVKLDTLASGLVDYNDFIQKKYDSSYVMTLNSFDGLIYVHLDKDFQKLKVINFQSPLVSWGFGNTNIAESSDGSVILNIAQIKIASNVNQQSNVVMKRLDKNDIEIDSKIYTDGPKITLPLGLCKSTQSGFFFTYLREQLVGNFWDYHYYLCKLDEDFNLAWKIKIEPILFSSYNQFALQTQIIHTLDGNYVVVGAFSTPQIDNVPSMISSAVIRKFSEQGEILWQRNHYLPFNETNIVGIEIKNVIATQDSGYCMVGNRTDLTVINAGGLGQKGYIVKTNCLGFLSGPTAAANHHIADDFKVSFINTSVQARSYTWYFGDGTSANSISLSDTVHHVYSTYGTYNAILIAHGCWGENDTIQFAVAPQKHNDPSLVSNGNGYFSLFPNPLNQGETFYIYLNELPEENGAVSIVIQNLEGKEVQKTQLLHKEGTYLLENSLASGMYVATLLQGGKMIQSRKFICN